MLVRELLELLNQPNVTVESVAMPIVGAGEKRVRHALKQAGAVHINRHGWRFEGDVANLDRQIHDFMESKTSAKPIIREVKVNASKDASKVIAKEKASKEKTVFTNVSKNDLNRVDALLGTSKTDKKKRVYRGFYFDEDVIEVIDSVKHGNKSDLLNEMIRLVLKDRGLL